MILINDWGLASKMNYCLLYYLAVGFCCCNKQASLLLLLLCLYRGMERQMSHGNSYYTVFPQLQTFAHFQARECAGSPPPLEDTDGADASVKSDAEQGCTQQVLQTWREETAPH